MIHWFSFRRFSMIPWLRNQQLAVIIVFIILLVRVKVFEVWIILELQEQLIVLSFTKLSTTSFNSRFFFNWNLLNYANQWAYWRTLRYFDCGSHQCFGTPLRTEWKWLDCLLSFTDGFRSQIRYWMTHWAEAIE